MTTTESRYRFQIWREHLSSKRALHLVVVLPSENYFLFRQPAPPKTMAVSDWWSTASEDSFLQLFIILFNLRATLAFANKDMPFATVILKILNVVYGIGKICSNFFQTAIDRKLHIYFDLKPSVIFRTE